MTNAIARSNGRRIPQPPLRPLIGNVLELNPNTPIQSMMELNKTYGPLFRIKLPGQDMVLVNDVAMSTEACDESRFEKIVHSVLRHLRDLAGDALFTAHVGEPNWAKAHRVLMPAFGPGAMRDTFDSMLDIAEQLMLKWERLGPTDVHDVADDMTRLTLDTIALCGFDYRFNSFYREQQHPFVDAMVRSLHESGQRGRRLKLQQKLMWMSEQRFHDDNAYMHRVCDDVIAHRRTVLGEASAPRDLLNLMMTAKDPVTGETLDDVNIRYQLVTFLIAGHETTSGLLSFAVHLLLEHPELLARARAHVDSVLGDEVPRFEHIAQLGYIDQILRETLRLYPTAPAVGVTPRHDTTLGGYEVKKGQVILMLPPTIHRDPTVWSDPERFDPDRFSPERRGSIPAKAWIPFGNGERACIGRAFAMQEATLVLSMLLQRFDIQRPAPYKLVVKETLTLKPEGLKVTVRRRHARPLVRTTEATTTASSPASSTTTAAQGVPLLVLYGSNAGTAENFARRIASDGALRGYQASCAALDDMAGKLPAEGAVVVVSASYNGLPPDNARAFCAWSSTWSADAFKGLRYAVFGCGSRDWASTYQAIPALLDDNLAGAGAVAVLPRGEADATADFFGQCDRWLASLWPALDAAFGVSTSSSTNAPLYALQLVAEPAAELVARNDLRFATVLKNTELVDTTPPYARSTRHLELQLPDDMAYEVGDTLAVLPENHPTVIARALRRFQLSDDATMVLSTTRPTLSTSLPVGRPVSVLEVLRRHVELQQPATQKDLEVLAAHNRCPPHKDHLTALATNEARYLAEVLTPRVSVLDLLERWASIELPLARFLELLPPMRLRRYSISSSPRTAPHTPSLTVTVVDDPALSGNGRYFGAASTYLQRVQPGDRIALGVRSTSTPFHPPENNSTPMVLIAAGSGLAPFRGFLQERAARAAAGEAAGPCLLFFGCRHPDVDALYRDELAAWQRDGLVEVLPAYSRVEPAAVDDEGQPVTYVQHRLWQERARVATLIEQGAYVFLCGDGRRMAPAARAVLARILTPAGAGEDDGRRRLGVLEQQGRYVADLFA